MKNALILASVVFAIGYSAAIAAQFAGLISFDVFGLPALIGGLTVSGIFGLVLSDYSRRPSFRVRTPRPAPTAGKVAPMPVVEDTPTMWTYTTRAI